MINFLRQGIVKSGGRLPVLIKLSADTETWPMTMVSADETGVAVLRPEGRWECYPWRFIEAVVIAGQDFVTEDKEGA